MMKTEGKTIFSDFEEEEMKNEVQTNFSYLEEEVTFSEEFNRNEALTHRNLTATIEKSKRGPYTKLPDDKARDVFKIVYDQLPEEINNLVGIEKKVNKKISEKYKEEDPKLFRKLRDLSKNYIRKIKKRKFLYKFEVNYDILSGSSNIKNPVEDYYIITKMVENYLENYKILTPAKAIKSISLMNQEMKFSGGKTTSLQNRAKKMAEIGII